MENIKHPAYTDDCLKDITTGLQTHVLGSGFKTISTLTEYIPLKAISVLYVTKS